MNKNDFRNPLIQSGAVLLFVFLLISIVANAGPHGMLGSIAALFSGLISGILFLIALFLGIIICVVIIIALFIAAVSIHSVDKARDIYSGLKNSLCSLYAAISSKFDAVRSKVATTSEEPSGPSPSIVQSTGTEFSDSFKKLQDRLARLEIALDEILSAQTNTDNQLNSLTEEVKELQDNSTLAGLGEQYNALAETQQGLIEKTDKLLSSLEVGTARLQDLEGQYGVDQAKIQSAIEKLHQKTSIPEVVTGILSYIDLPEDRETITEKAEEAVSRGMTYAQIDAFFKSSLTPKIYKVLSEHPRLTKDFLRSVKKKFA